jgi:hypothetical protein
MANIESEKLMARSSYSGEMFEWDFCVQLFLLVGWNFSGIWFAGRFF